MKTSNLEKLTLYTFDSFEKYPEVLNSVSTRQGGVSKGSFSSLNIAFHVGDDLDLVLRNRKVLTEALSIDLHSLTCGDQVHGAHIEVVTVKTAGRGCKSLESTFPSTDALVTNVPNVPLMVQTADCAAVSFYDSKNHAIGIAHAGRVGVEKEIVINTIETMHDNFGTCAENLVVGIGPCILPCCYPVDLPSKIKEQLVSAGVKLDNVEVSDICTSDNNDIFYSYRADGRETGRFANIIMLQK